MMIGVVCDPLQHTSMYQRAEEGQIDKIKTRGEIYINTL